MRQFPKDLLVIVVAIIAVLYMINPTLGVFELIPDNLPVVGNIDEAAATAIILGALRYFNIDLARLFGRRDDQENVVSGQASRRQPQ
jgi:uncharacterized membrane protein YkvA (DUF1232 family)